MGERGRDSEKEENGVPERGQELKNIVNTVKCVGSRVRGEDIKGERKRVMRERGNKEMEVGGLETRGLQYKKTR